MKLKYFNFLPLAALAALFLALFCTPTPAAAQSVLLTAANYALLGGTAITVGGPGPNPIMNGNVGLSTAATSNITGFPPAVVSGTTVSGSPAGIISTGGATGQAGLDLITARNALFAMPHIQANDLSNLNLGSLAALKPGVYFSSSASNQTGALVLDANFQNGVAWVFDFSLSLTTAANATVTYINLGTNGGSDNGVYFNAATAITIGDSNTILGNYLAGTSISFTGITTTLANGGARALAGAAVSFAGPAPLGFNATGGPGGGDNDGGLTYNSLGQLVPLTPGGTTPPAGASTGYVLLSATGSFAPGPSGVVLVPGTKFPTTTMTLDGNSSNGSAPASLTIDTATVTLTGTGNTYTGGTVVTNGTLIAATTNLPVNGAIALNTSTLNFNQTADGTFGGVISGTGTVVKIGPGALTVTAANTYTGGTVVNAGTLIASTASLPVNQGVLVAGSGVLVFNQAAGGTFGGAITGGGKVQKQGTGALTLTVGTSSPVDVQAGSLFSGSGLGATTVSVGAFLGGTPTITGNLVSNGTVSPGNSPGTINVTGNYTQSSTGVLVIEIASGVLFDKLAITGSASLAGGLQVSVLGGFNPSGQSFTFLTAPGGVSGTFGVVNGTASNSAATGFTVVYAPTSVALVFSQLPFSGFATTPNQTALGTTATGSTSLTPPLDVVPAAGQIPGALNAISPQGYEIWSDIAFAHANTLVDSLARDDGLTTGHDNFYYQNGQVRARARGDSDVDATTFTTTTNMVGGDKLLAPDVTVGGFVGLSETRTGLGSVGSNSTVKDKFLGVRAISTAGPWYALGVLSYGFDDYQSTRFIAFPGTAATAISDTRGHQWIADLTAGRHFTNGDFTVTPFGGLLLSRWETNGFTETGAGVFNATVNDQSARSLSTQLGVSAEVNWNFFGLMLHPHVRAAWLSEFADGRRVITGAFGTNNYAVVTRSPQRDSALVSGGLDFILGPRAVLYTEFTAQSGGIVKFLSDWRAGVAVKF